MEEETLNIQEQIPTEEELAIYQDCIQIRDLSYLLADQLDQAQQLTAENTDITFKSPWIPGEILEGQIVKINYQDPAIQLPDPTPYGDLGFVLSRIKNTEPNKEITTNTLGLKLECKNDGKCICSTLYGNKIIDLEDQKFVNLKMKTDA